MNKGTLHGIAAYLIWGFFPIYFKMIEEVPPLQIVANRILWSFLLLALLLFVRQQWKVLFASIKGPRFLLAFLIASVLLAVNWLTYVWAVNADYIIEASLGYYINPLVSVLLGVIFLRERLRPLQWAPIGLAAFGVLFLTISYGRLPWIALLLAGSFGLYGLAKKTAPLGSFYGLSIETGMLIIPSLVYLTYLQTHGQGALGHASPGIVFLLALSGPITTVPLLLFGSAAKKMDLYMLGVLQYIAPTMQFLIGVFIYGEPFTHADLVGFGIIWAALALLSVEGYLVRRRRQAFA
ncbi:MAG: EamA family transporter RarD [Anaerolineales bacterium]|jgi:chloramphenicol-sensitive protein RarD|nr:EamA family transporter RarD [Anaerolineales bacterium]